MKDLLFLREKSLKEILELIFQAYIDSYSDPSEVLKKIHLVELITGCFVL